VRVADEGLAVFTRLGLDKQVSGLAIINNRGNALVGMGRYDAAIADFRHVVELRRALYGRSPELATALGNLAVTLSKGVLTQDVDAQGRTYAEVARLLEEAYAMSKELGSETGRSLAVIRTALAQTYVRLGELAKAEPLAEEAVRIGTQNFGANSIFAGVGYRARADVRIAQKRYAEARADIAAAKLAFSSLGKGSEQHLASLVTLLEAIDRADTAQ
jgi:tetratricopeptide (TPR) repeat protein